MAQRLTYRRRHCYATQSNKTKKVKTPGEYILAACTEVPRSCSIDHQDSVDVSFAETDDARGCEELGLSLHQHPGRKGQLELSFWSHVAVINVLHQTERMQHSARRSPILGGRSFQGTF